MTDRETPRYLSDSNLETTFTKPCLTTTVTFSAGLSFHQDAPHVRLANGVELDEAGKQFCEFVEGYFTGLRNKIRAETFREAAELVWEAVPPTCTTQGHIELIEICRALEAKANV